MGSIYSADLAPQRTILIECTPMVCIRYFTDLLQLITICIHPPPPCHDRASFYQNSIMINPIEMDYSPSTVNLNCTQGDLQRCSVLLQLLL